MIRVLIADSQPVVQAGLHSILRDDPDIEVVGTATSGEEAVRLAGEVQPDVLLTEVRFAREGPPVLLSQFRGAHTSGLDAIRQIRARQRSLLAIVLTSDADNGCLQETLSAGATGYLRKDCSPVLLCYAIHACCLGGSMISSDQLHFLTDSPAPLPQAALMLSHLTKRELEVLALLGQGMSNKDICSFLYITAVTAKKHIYSIMGKLGTSNQTKAAIFAAQLTSNDSRPELGQLRAA